MKKIIITALMSFTLLIPTTFVKAEEYIENNNGVLITKEKYENFLKLGFNEDEIADMTLELYESYSDMDYVEEDKKETKYYRETTVTNYRYTNTYLEEITEEEYNSEEVNDGISLFATDSYETTYKKLTVTSLSFSTVYPNRRNVTSELTWKKLPKVHSHDIFAARVTNGEIVLNSYSGAMISKQTKYGENCEILGTDTYTTTYNNGSGVWNTSKATLGLNGVGFTGLLHGPKNICVNDLGQYPTTIQGYSSMLSFQSVKGATVYVTYQHATKTVDQSVFSKYTFSSAGLGGVVYFSSSTLRDSYDKMEGLSLTL